MYARTIRGTGAGDILSSFITFTPNLVTHEGLVNRCDVTGEPIVYRMSTVSGANDLIMPGDEPFMFSHRGNVVAINIENGRKKLYKLDFEPVKIDRNLYPPRLAVGDGRYAVITIDGIEYFDRLEDVLAVCDTDFAKLLTLEARLRGLEEHIYWMPGGPGAAAAASSFECLAKKQ